MPHVVNGIGTWYYGKRRIHSIRGNCEFCNRTTDLVSYDTTLFFVVAFVPLIPLSKKRILQQCSSCQRHRVLDLAKWKHTKKTDGDALLENLRHDPDNREAVLHAIQFATGYQDEPLFDNIVATLAGHRTDDAAIQAQLGAAYGYFSRWYEAEQAYRASLTAEDSEEVREQLALALLKQHRPEAARPCLQHVLDNKKREGAGMVYVLVDGYQAQGLHEEALEIMEERDRAFPDWADTKDYKKQRKTSMRYRGTGKRIRAAFLETSKSGYREGNWTAHAPRWVGLFVVLGLIGLYFGSAIWTGQSRKVYFVNGTSQPYAIVLEGEQHVLPPNAATPLHVPEGDVQVAFADAKLGLEPIQCHIETSFWGRPFDSDTFVVNLDQSAIIEERTLIYAQNAPPSQPPLINFGKAFYHMSNIDYEFQPVPQTLEAKAGDVITKHQVNLAPNMQPEDRLSLTREIGQPEQAKICKKVLSLDPNSTLFLYLYVRQLPPNEGIAFLESRLDDRPFRIEWHRAYQTLMERAKPEIDLRPRYRELLASTKGSADALYLLARVEPDLDESDKLCRKAAAAIPPSGYAVYGLGYRALCAGRFAEARVQLEKAVPLMSEKTLSHHILFEAQLANGDYDALLQSLQRDAQVPGGKLAATMRMVLVNAIRKDKTATQRAVAEVVQLCSPAGREVIRKSLNMTICCAERNVDGYLKEAGNTPSFEVAFLQGRLDQAADFAAKSNDDDGIAKYGLLYLAASGGHDDARAVKYWEALVALLKKGEREERKFAAILTGAAPFTGGVAERLALEPSMKRVLLAVLAQRNPKEAGDMLALAKRLNFQGDAVSLCFWKYLGSVKK